MGNKTLNSPSCPSYYPVYFFLKFYAQKQLNFFARAKKLESSFFALAKNEKLRALCLCDLCVNLKYVFFHGKTCLWICTTHLSAWLELFGEIEKRFKRGVFRCEYGVLHE